MNYIKKINTLKILLKKLNLDNDLFLLKKAEGIEFLSNDMKNELAEIVKRWANSTSTLP
jgi:hypothetical protein